MSVEIFTPVRLTIAEGTSVAQIDGIVIGRTLEAAPRFDVRTSDRTFRDVTRDRIEVVGLPQVPDGHVWGEEFERVGRAA